jgi:4'-phosphopantetheinyl transferase EntD
MIQFDLLEAWRTLLPASVEVSAGPLLSDAAPVTSAERASIGNVDPDRMKEFATGRVYAKRALAKIGFDCAELPVGSDRAPLWPDGAIGSITHVRGPGTSHVAAVVGRSSDVRGIGIDVELASSALPAVWATILTQHELKQVLSLPVDIRGIEVVKRWCMKEAITKAVRRSIDPLQIETENGDAGEYLASLNGSRVKANLQSHFRGRTRQMQGLVLAAVIVQR